MISSGRDSEIDAWLRTRRSLLRAQDAADPLEPPAQLDSIVIDRARRAITQPTPPQSGFFRHSRWSAPVAIAATVLLSFTVVLQINRFQNSDDAAALQPEETLAPLALPAPPASAREMRRATAAQRMPASAARSAQDWWALVQRLQQQGLFDEAARELEALHRAYPDFVAPAAAAASAAPAAVTPPR